MGKRLPDNAPDGRAPFNDQVKTSTGFGLRQVLFKQGPAVVVLGILALVLSDRIADLDVARLRDGLASLTRGQWLLGISFTALSFWALGQYDVVVHRILGLSTGRDRAAISGMSAIAVGQTVGMGALTSSFARWRLLPELGLIDAARIAGLVTVSFFLAWGVVTAVALLCFGAALPLARPLALVILAASLVLLGLSVLRPGLLARLPIPSLRAGSLILGFTALDTIAAAAALWVLMPEGVTIGFGTLATAYLLSLGAGLVLTSPGGVGPFEIAMIALVPSVPDEQMLAGILAFRVVYYALPAAFGALRLAKPMRYEARDDKSAPLRIDPRHLPLTVEAALEQAPRAEAALLRHGRFDVLRDGRGWPLALVAGSGQSLIQLGDSLRADAATGTPCLELSQAARAVAKTPLVYKCGARLAARLRREGWATLPIAQEAWLDPRAFTTQGASRRQLRRKLRAMDSIQIRIALPDTPDALPLDAMEAIAAGWRARQGGERGFSMGVWDPATLTHAAVVLGFNENRQLLGFATFHVNQSEWTLDLMRQAEAAPDGFMHALITRAIEAAGNAGANRLSLAAVPAGECETEPRLYRMLRARLDRSTGAAGLRQFKRAFGPSWETLYIAAPTRVGLVLGAIDVAREILRPNAPSGTRERAGGLRLARFRGRASREL